jgi:hypothetical protein
MGHTGYQIKRNVAEGDLYAIRHSFHHIPVLRHNQFPAVPDSVDPFEDAFGSLFDCPKDNAFFAIYR